LLDFRELLLGHEMKEEKTNTAQWKIFFA